jgi:TPR repeat protein
MLPLVTGFNVPDLAGTVVAAKSGDASAATRVANFYALAANDPRKALEYYRLAARFGGAEERDTLNSYISVLKDD